MKKFNFKGTGVAIVTPFTSKGNIDNKGLKKLVNHLINGNVDYIVALGTTGEAATLNKEEKKEVVQLVLEYNNERVPVVLGLGGNNTSEVCNDFKLYDFKNISAILSVSPFYNKPNQKGIVEHYKQISNVSPVPIILYNVPSRTGSNLNADTTLQLANEFKNIRAIKEASGNIEQCMRIIANKPKNFELISGDDNLTFPLMACGAGGVISVAAMVYPDKFSTMINHCLKGEFQKALKLHYQIMPVTDLLFADGNPGGVKEALNILGICEPYLRLPLYAPNKLVVESLKKLVNKK
ncbi:MAG: 4-hydroxy-tetrahydrodipicolinate synthase [Bacteroidia bacterium]